MNHDMKKQEGDERERGGEEGSQREGRGNKRGRNNIQPWRVRGDAKRFVSATPLAELLRRGECRGVTISRGKT